MPNQPQATLSELQSAESQLLLQTYGRYPLQLTRGHGVHLYTSSLASVTPGKIMPWDTAQAGYVQSSLRLSSEINSALTHAEIPVTLGRTFLLPMDNLACPAVAVEIAPLGRATVKTDLQPTPVTDATYQKDVVTALAAALEEWQHDWTAGSEAAP